MAKDKDMAKFIKELKSKEGNAKLSKNVHSKTTSDWGAYYDDAGHLTTGVGDLVYKYDRKKTEKKNKELEEKAILKWKKDTGYDPFNLKKEQSDDLLRKRINSRIPEIKKKIKVWDSVSSDTRTNLLSSWFRGSLPKSKDTLGYLNSGDFEAASKEFLDHGEYRRRKAALAKRRKTNPKARDGVVERMEKTSKSMKGITDELTKDVSSKAMEEALSKKHLVASNDPASDSYAEYFNTPSKKASSDISIEGETPSVKGTLENTAGVLRPGSDSSTDYLMEPLRQSLKTEPPKDPIKEVFRNSGVDSPGLKMEEDNSTPATDKIASEGAAAFIGVEQKNKEAALRDLKNNDERNRIKENARTGKNVTPMDQLKEALMYFGPQIAASIIVGPEAGAITHKLMEGYRDRLDKQQARAGRNANFQQVDRFVDKEGRPVKFDPVSGKYLDIQGNPVTDFKNLRHERFGQSHKLRKKQHELSEKKAGMLSSKEIEKLSDTITVRKQIEELEKLKEGVQTGPIVGRMTSLAQSLGLNTDADFKALKVQTQSVLSNYVKSISGSQVTEAEAVRLMGVIPSVNDPDELFNAKLKEFEKIVKIGQQAFGFSIAEGNTLKKHQVKALMALLDGEKEEKPQQQDSIESRASKMVEKLRKIKGQKK